MVEKGENRLLADRGGMAFFVIVIIAVHAQREPVGTITKQSRRLRLGTVIVPRYEGNSGVEVRAVHLQQQLLEVKGAIPLCQPGVVDGQVCEMRFRVPADFPAGVS